MEKHKHEREKEAACVTEKLMLDLSHVQASGR